MEVVLKATSFHGVTLEAVIFGSTELKKELHDIMTEGIAAGTVQPLPRTVFSNTDVEQAFRYSFHNGNKLVTELLRNMLSSETTAMILSVS
jgi:fatty acid synthase